MDRVSGRLREGDRIVFGEVTAILVAGGGRVEPSVTGRLEVHQGGLLAGHVETDRTYVLDLMDGRSGAIRLTHVNASNSAGIAFMQFRLEGPLGAEFARPYSGPAGSTLPCS